MEHILLTAFLCFVAFVALGQAAYACPRQHSAEKLYAPPVRKGCIAPVNSAPDTSNVCLTMISGGKEKSAASPRENEPARRAA